MKKTTRELFAEWFTGEPIQTEIEPKQTPDPTYPNIKDGGEAYFPHEPTAREKFEEDLARALSFNPRKSNGWTKII